MLRRFLIVSSALLLGIGLVACGPSAGSDDDDDGGTNTCSGNETRCVGSQYQTCQNGVFEIAQACPHACDADRGGCIDCIPGSGNVCNGNTVMTCNPDGTFGTTVEQCAAGTECTGGTCQRTCTADGVDLIYVVDESYRLLSFDPRLIGSSNGPFSVIGQLNCPAGPSVPDWGDTGPATPFSMAVDRDAVAWVLYTSGEIFNVSTQNAGCSTTTFQARQNAGSRTWDLFGMGYVTDQAGGDTERLWIGGGNADAQVLGDLAWVDGTSLAIQPVGPMTTTSEYSPELTGLGDATLWGFYPGLSSAFVQQIDKATGGGTGPMLSIPGGLGGQVVAWAFAQWGGKFYLFVTTSNGLSTNSTVRTIDRSNGAYASVAQNLPYIIVGAGVSTCAPIVIGRDLPELDPASLPIDGSNWVH